jgi:hypothetical protein
MSRREKAGRTDVTTIDGPLKPVERGVKLGREEKSSRHIEQLLEVVVTVDILVNLFSRSTGCQFSTTCGGRPIEATRILSAERYDVRAHATILPAACHKACCTLSSK